MEVGENISCLRAETQTQVLFSSASRWRRIHVRLDLKPAPVCTFLLSGLSEAALHEIQNNSSLSDTGPWCLEWAVLAPPPLCQL